MRLLRCRIKQRGTITLMVLVLLVVFVVITVASVQLISRQSGHTSDEEQTGQAFGLADAGVQYILWILRPEAIGGGGVSPENLAADVLGSPEPIRQAVEDEEEVVIGTFAAEVLQANTNVVRVRVLGRDQVRPDICEAVEAEYQKDAGYVFQLVHWNYLLGYDCD